MMGTLLCLLLPLSGCPEYVDFAPSIPALEARTARFDGKDVEVVGNIEHLDQWHSSAGPYEYEVFQLCTGGKCVRVFMEDRSPIHNGDLVRVRGPYYRVYHSGQRTFYNEIEATEIIPLR